MKAWVIAITLFGPHGDILNQGIAQTSFDTQAKCESFLPEAIFRAREQFGNAPLKLECQKLGVLQEKGS